MPICPSCEKDDRIYRVSAIHSGGISEGTFSTSEGRVSGTSQTAISRKLSPLPKPGIYWPITGCSILLVILGIFGSDAFMLTLDFRALITSPGLIIGLAIYFFALLYVQSEMPRWTNSMKKWDRCYYCDRDGIVFDPTNQTTMSVDTFRDYLRKMEPASSISRSSE